MDVLVVLVYENTMLDTDLFIIDNANIVKELKLWGL